MRILGLDLETTGIDVKTARIIELGLCIWDVERAAPIVWYNNLVYHKTYPKIPEIITSITGIRQDDMEFAISPVQMIEDCTKLMGSCDLVCAHNGNNFDKPILYNEFAREGFHVPELPWFDTMTDIDYNTTDRKLGHLAAHHGFINPFPHRALSDVLSMLKILSSYNVNECIELSREPHVLLIAETKAPWNDPAPEGQKETDKAKAMGFRWNGSTKAWERRLRKSLAKSVVTGSPFPIKIKKE